MRAGKQTKHICCVKSVEQTINGWIIARQTQTRPDARIYFIQNLTETLSYAHQETLGNAARVRKMLRSYTLRKWFGATILHYQTILRRD